MTAFADPSAAIGRSETLFRTSANT
jgi:hypothetical protein